MRKPRFYCYALCIAALLSSCEKERSTREKLKEEMKFLASYLDQTNTKAQVAFPVGNKSTIFAYESGATISTASPVAGTPLEATCTTGSVLSATSSLYLPKGTYDFYSVSLNNSNQPSLTFASGLSGQLTNEKDYLWSMDGNVSEGGTVNFSYSHKAVGIEVNILKGSGVGSISVTSVKLTPSKADASSKMNLATGVIAASTLVDNSVAMQLTGTKGTYIMLPLSSKAINIEVVANVTIGETSVSGKVYKATIPAQTYNGGTYYKLNLNVTASELVFSGAVLEDWTTQVISDLTLIEQ